MARSSRNNPLALAVLVSLYERPMHPYEAATVLRQRNKHESVRLNYGSLYAVVDSLERRGLIEAQETARAGRLPERTVYRLTDAGRAEIHEWLSEMISVPAKEYTTFLAALSFLPALPPDLAVELLTERAGRLEVTLAAARGAREYVEKQGLPRLFWIESEYETALWEAELAYVRGLAEEIASGELEGTAWWRQVHYGGEIVLPPVMPWAEGPGRPAARRGGTSAPGRPNGENDQSDQTDENHENHENDEEGS